MGIEKIKNSYNNLDLLSMNELLSRNNQIAAYIDSLGSSIPGEEQPSVLLSIGGLSGSTVNSAFNCVENSMCMNVLNCENTQNGISCKNYSGACTGSSNRGECINSKEPYQPPTTNVTIRSCG